MIKYFDGKYTVNGTTISEEDAFELHRYINTCYHKENLIAAIKDEFPNRFEKIIGKKKLMDQMLDSYIQLCNDDDCWKNCLIETFDIYKDELIKEEK